MEQTSPLNSTSSQDERQLILGSSGTVTTEGVEKAPIDVLYCKLRQKQENSKERRQKELNPQ